MINYLDFVYLENLMKVCVNVLLKRCVLMYLFCKYYGNWYDK